METSKILAVNTSGNSDILDIASKCAKKVKETDLENGVLTVFNPGSTGGLSTIEYAPNLVKDLHEFLEVFAPFDKKYEHGKTWHDDNGSFHIRSTIMGPSISIPFIGGESTLGTWQQIIFCDFDTRPRRRELVL